MTPRDRVEHAVERAGEVMSDKMAEVKPKLRGWLHAGTAPLAARRRLVLVAAPTASTRGGRPLFALSTLLLFVVSAVYHRGSCSPRVGFLQRFDHANIFLLIAGTATPYAVLFLGVGSSTAAAGRVAGCESRALCSGLWIHAPRWLFTPMYLALGWAAVFFIPQFLDGADMFSSGIAVATLVLVAVGGILYTLGGRGLRPQAAQPVAPLVRLPRGLPLLHGRWRSRPITSASRSRRTRCADRARPAGEPAHDGQRSTWPGRPTGEALFPTPPARCLTTSR